MRMETKICPRCENECREIDPRCKKCGHKFYMICEGCGRDVRGFRLCGECRIPGYKRTSDERNPGSFHADLFDFERLDKDIDRREIDKSHAKHAHYFPYYPWDCYDQHRRLQKLNKKQAKKGKKQ